MKVSMNIEQESKRKKKIKASIKKVNKIHGKTLEKLGEGVDDKFITRVDAFIEKNRSALNRLAKK
jgi:hypothetical protein